MSASENIVWHGGDVTPADRQRVLGQRGCTLWLTGLSGSGKSTVAVAVEKALLAAGHACYRLDGDNVRHGLCGDLGFSAEDRTENIRRVGEVAALMADAGLIVLSSFISPYRTDRAAVAALHQKGAVPFFEVFVDAPLETAEARDPKGLYKKARAGQIKQFTGIDDPYETPQSPALRLPTAELTLEQEVEHVLTLLRNESILPV
ncbi:MAG: adenylyl-sulfate kinase [Planctomycetota bacterium]